MDHFGGHVVEGAGAQLTAFAVAGERGGALKDGVGFVGAVPVFADMDGFGRADHKLGGLGFWVHMEDGDFGGTVSKVGEDFGPFEIVVFGEDGLGHGRGGGVGGFVGFRGAGGGGEGEKCEDESDGGQGEEQVDFYFHRMISLREHRKRSAAGKEKAESQRGRGAVRVLPLRCNPFRVEGVGSILTLPPIRRSTRVRPSDGFDGLDPTH